MENPEKLVNLSAILLTDPLDWDKISQAAHLARQFVSVHQQAARDLSEVLGTNKPHKETRIAAAYWILANYEQAAEHAGKDTGAAIARIILGALAERVRDWKTALEHYTKIAKENTQYELLRAGCLRSMGNVDDALKSVHGLERELSDHPALHYEKARCLELVGKPEEAIAAYKQALSYNPAMTSALFHLARLLDLRGDDAEAIRYYEKIGPLAPDTYINSLLNLATLYEDAGNEMEAMRCCQMVLEQQPLNRRARMIADSISAASGMFYSPEETKQNEKLDALLHVPITDFELSVRSRNCLSKMNIRCLGDLVRRTESELLAYKNFGETSLREIREILNSRNLRLGMLREDAATRAAYSRSASRARDEMMMKPVDFLDLSVRSRKCMERLGIRTIAQLCNRSEVDLENAKNFGRVSLNEIKKRLVEYNLSLRASNA